jgi:glutamyl-tRNA reductase
LENRVKKNIEVRSSEVEKAEAIIEDEIEILEDIMERRKLYAAK